MHTKNSNRGFANWEKKIHIALWALCGFVILYNQLFGHYYGINWNQDGGIACINATNEKLTAVAQHHNIFSTTAYESFDHGITWEIAHKDISHFERHNTVECDLRNVNHVSATQTNRITWRISENGQMVERSTDNTRSWQTVYRPPAGQEVRKSLYQQSARESIQHKPPAYLAINPQTQDLIVAMNHEGILIIDVDGHVTRSAVGPYRFIDIHQTPLWERLNQEFLITLPFLYFSVIFTGWQLWATDSRGIKTRIFCTLLVIVWVFALLNYKDTSAQYLGSVRWYLIVPYHIVLIYLMLLSATHLRQFVPEKFFATQLLSITLPALFFLPHFLWGIGIIQSLNWAHTLGLFLALIAWRTGQKYMT